MECELSPQLPRSAFRRYRLDAIFRGHKWDPQIFDKSSIADRAIVIGRAEWRDLKTITEALFAETLQIENDLQANTAANRFLSGRAWRRLRGLPRCKVEPARLMRFDFHPTDEGWRLSEVNSDVPGGINESSTFAELWPTKGPGWRSAGNPGTRYVSRLIERYRLTSDSVVGLIHATAYSDDWQQMDFLRAHFEQVGVEAIGAAPTQIDFDGDRMSYRGRELNAAIRFFPGDWLLFARQGKLWFENAPEYLSNPLKSLFSQNKFFPVACRKQRLSYPHWGRLLPATSDLALRDLATSNELVKPSFGRVGEDIARASTLPLKKKVRIALDLALHRGLWVRQAPFKPKNLGSTSEPLNVCLGIYCLDGEVIGCYGRVTTGSIVNIDAADAPVFIAEGNTHA